MSPAFQGASRAAQGAGLTILLMVQKSGVHQVEGKVVYRNPILYKVLYIQTVVVWDFFHQQYTWQTQVFAATKVSAFGSGWKFGWFFLFFSTGTRFLACKLMILWQLLWMNGTRAQRSHGILWVTSLNPNNLTTEPVWAAHALPQQDTSRILQDLLKDESDIYGFPPW